MSRCLWVACGVVVAVAVTQLAGCDDEGGAALTPAPKPAPVNPLAADPAANPLVGSFRGDTLQVELRPEGDGFSGSITHRGKQYAARATRNADGVAGAFTVDGAEMAFTAQVEGDTMTLESGGATHTMRRVVPAAPVNPLAATGDDFTVQPAPAAVAAEPAPAPTPVPAPAPGPTAAVPAPTPAPAPAPPANAVVVERIDMQTFKHPIGFTFEYPRGWTAQDADGGVAMVPPDAQRDAQGQPLEVLYIASQDAPGINDPADPQVLAFLDTMIAQMMPAMKRTGEPARTQTLLGGGTTVTYEGKTPVGFDGQVDVYTTLHRGNGIFLVHLGRKDLVTARRGVAGRIFGSFGWTQGQLDPNLVGVWQRKESASSGVDQRGYVGSRTKTTWSFGSDGAVAYGVTGTVFGHVTGDGGQVTIDPSAAENVSKGAWSAGDGKLYILWDGGGSEVWEYKVFPHTDNQVALKLAAPGSEKPLYFIRQ